MRLVTNDPLEYLAWVGICILGVAAFFGILFIIAWFQTRGK